MEPIFKNLHVNLLIKFFQQNNSISSNYNPITLQNIFLNPAFILVLNNEGLSEIDIFRAKDTLKILEFGNILCTRDFTDFSVKRE